MKRLKKSWGTHAVPLAIFLAILGGCKGCPPETDSEAPTVVILSLKPDSTYSGKLTLQFEARDNKSVAKVECYADGRLIGVDANEPWFLEWNTAQVANGSYQLQAKAYDGAKNAGSSASVRVKIANQIDNTGEINARVRAIALLARPPLPARSLLAVSKKDTMAQDSTFYEYTEREYDLVNNAREILAFGSALNSVIWPGALVQGEKIENGTPTIIQPEHRPDLTLTVDLPGAPEPSLVVENPRYSSITTAINTLLQRNAGGPTAARVHFDSTSAYSHKQALIDLEISPAWLGNLEFHFAEEVATRSILVKFTQAYYTISCDQPSSPAAFFDPQLNPSALDAWMGPGNPPLYISSVTYGRLLLFSVTSTYSQTEMYAALQAAIGGNATAWDKEVLDKSRLEIVVIGGAAAAALKPIVYHDIAGYIEEGINWSPASPGLPISYAVSHLRNNELVTIGLMTRYKARSYQLKQQPITVIIDKIHVHGDCDTDIFDGDGEFFWEFKANGEIIYNVSSDNPIGLGKNQILPVNTGKTISIPKRMREPIEVIGRLFEEDRTGKDALPPFTRTYLYDLTKTRIDEVVPCFKDHGCNVTVYYHVDFGN